MKALVAVPIMSVLFGCQQPEPAIPDVEFASFSEQHPGMIQACLDEVRYGGYIKWRPDDPNCYEMLPAQQWSGLWEHGWEWTNFCPEPAQTCDWMAERGTWLEFAGDVKLEADLTDGVHRIIFIGRRTKVPGNFGHLASYKHLMIVDRIISLEPADTKR